MQFLPEPTPRARAADDRNTGPARRTIASMASATEALSDAVLAIAAEHAVEPVLQKLVDAARELAGAQLRGDRRARRRRRLRALHHLGHERDS